MDDLTVTGRHGFTYHLKTERIAIGAADLTIAALVNADQVIDDMFAHLERIGAPDLLTEYCPYFGCLWPAARILAAELAGRDLRAARVLELGCGLALPGLVAGALGADVTVTDAHPDVERFLALNQGLNPHIQRLRFLPLDWRNPSRISDYSIICGSDILYDTDHAAAIAELCAHHRRSLKEVLITDPGRPYAKDLYVQMAQFGFAPTTREVPANDGTRPITVSVMRFVPGLPP